MAAPDEPLVDEPDATTEARPSVVDRLTAFMADHWHGNDYPFGQTQDTSPELAVELLKPLAEDVLRDFFRVDVDATSIFAVPGVDVETLEGFAMVHWGPMAGRLAPDELRALGAAFVETAEAADLDSAMMRWLLRDPGSNRAGATKILTSFRQFRAELDVAEETPGAPE